MKRKGFTLVELLVVIAIIALLMGILMPALARVKQIANRLVCGTNLSGIGKAMMIYSVDNSEQYPRAGGRNATWSTTGVIKKWDADTEKGAFGQNATITSSFYLLIKYSDLTPKQFICKGDVGTNPFLLSDYTSTTAEKITDPWDFGMQPALCVSFAYHMPYGDETGRSFALASPSNPSSPILSDRSPYLDTNADAYKNDANPELPDGPDWDTVASSYIDKDRTGNAAAHQRDGQNVLFNDSHVGFEKYPNLGVEHDNIFLAWRSETATTDEDKQVKGWYPDKVGDYAPKSVKDAYLVNEDQDTVGKKPTK